MFVRTRLKYVEQPLPDVQTVGATLRGMPVRKGRGGGVGRNAYFSRPTLLIRRPTTGSRTKDGRPAETINAKDSGKVNLIFYKLNLFPIFLVDKVKKKNKQSQKKTRKIVICRIMKNFLLSQPPVPRNANSPSSICKFKSNPSILNRVVPQVYFIT